MIRLRKSALGPTGNAHYEQMFSGLPPAADIRQRGWHVGSVPQPAIKTYERDGEEVISKGCAILRVRAVEGASSCRSEI